MGLLDVFRPRWKHSNPEIRLEAIRTLDDDEALAQSASRDGDERIRRLAIKQLIDPWRLQNVAGVQTDDKLRLMALGRARELFVEIALSSKETERSALAAVRDLDSQEHLADIAMKATRAAVRTQALDLVVSKAALVSIVRKSANADLRRAALARIADADALKQLALQERDPQFAGLLLDRLGPGELVEVAQKARHKPVAKMARQRTHLDDVKTEGAKAKAPVSGPTFDLEALKRNARQFQLAREFEALAERAGQADDDDGRRAGAMQAEWAQVGGDAEPSVRVRVERAVDRWNRVYEAAAETKRKQEQRQAASRAAVKARALAERMSAPDPETTAQPEAPRAVESADPAVDSSAAAATLQDAPRVERAQPSPEMLESELLALDTLKKQLVVAAQSDRLRLLDAGLKELRNADRRLSRLPDDKREVLQAEFAELKTTLTKRLAEVKQGEEWKRWVNVQRLEKLCVQAEVLRDVLPEFPDKEQAPVELANLRTAWRSSVGPVPPAKRDELWLRFKTACDAVMAIVIKSRPGVVEPENSMDEPSADASATQVSVPQVSVPQVSVAEVATTKMAAEVSAAQEPPAGDPPTPTPPVGEPPAKTPPSQDPPAGDPPEEAPPASEPPAGDPPSETPPAHDPPIGDPAEGPPPVSR